MLELPRAMLICRKAGELADYITARMNARDVAWHRLEGR